MFPKKQSRRLTLEALHAVFDDNAFIRGTHLLSGEVEALCACWPLHRQIADIRGGRHLHDGSKEGIILSLITLANDNIETLLLTVVFGLASRHIEGAILHHRAGFIEEGIVTERLYIITETDGLDAAAGGESEGCHRAYALGHGKAIDSRLCLQARGRSAEG